MNQAVHSKLLRTALLGCLLAFGAACERSPQSSAPEVLRMGVLPDLQPSALREQHAPLVKYLSDELGQDVELVIPDDYAHLVQLFGDGSVDIAFFGGATFVSAEAKFQAVPLVMRDIDTRFTTYFLARYGAGENRVSDFEGKVIGFGSTLSTSGHFMPRYFLGEQGIIPETYFSAVLYSGAHDATVEMLLQGEIDLAAVNSQVVNSMLLEGRLSEASVKIVWETPIYSDYVWASQPNWSDEYSNQVRDAFLRLSPSTERDAEILGLIGAGGFLPATPGDFARLRSIVLESSSAGTDPGSQDR